MTASPCCAPRIVALFQAQRQAAFASPHAQCSGRCAALDPERVKNARIAPRLWSWPDSRTREDGRKGGVKGLDGPPCGMLRQPERDARSYRMTGARHDVESHERIDSAAI